MMLRALALLALVSCGGSSNRLFGSISEVYELQFDKVVVNRVDKFLVIEYQKANGAKTLKLSVYVDDLTIAPGNTIDLSGKVGTTDRATAQRIVETTTINIELKTGTLVFDSAPVAGQQTSGTFRTTTTEGRTLNGDFQGTVIQL